VPSLFDVSAIYNITEQTIAFSMLMLFTKMSTQKILISFDEYKKLKQIEKKYYDLQNTSTGKIFDCLK